MNQNEFFNILMDGLKDFPEAKLSDIISYYDNKFSHGLTLGKTEEETITELGNPNLIVNQYRNEFLDTVANSEQFNNDNYSNNINVENFNTKKSNYDFTSDKAANNNITTNTTSIIYDDTINATNVISNNITDNDIPDTISTNNSKIIIDNEILSTINTLNDLSNDINDSPNNDEINSLIDNTLSDIKASQNTYEDINSNNSFYDLYTSTPPTESKDINYENSKLNNSNYTYTNNNSNYRKSQSNNVNIILKFCIVIVTLLIFSPVITGIITFILGLLGVAISILVGSIGLLVGGTFTSLVGIPNLPMFISNFPYPVIVLFSLGSISLSLFLTLIFYYLCKFFVQLLIKAYRVLKLKGGDI